MKKSIDIILIILFLIGLSSMFLPKTLHEILGYALMILIVIHNVINKNFYRTKKLNLNVVSIIIFAVSLILLTVSGFMLSNDTHFNYNWRSIHLGAAVVSLICLMIHLLLHARRHIKNKIFRVLAFITLLIAISSIFGLPYLDRWFHKVEINKNEIIEGDKVNMKGKVATVYFSRVGNTNFPSDIDAVSGASIMRDGNELIGNAQMIALMAQNAVGGEIFEIQTINQKYSASYSETVKIAKAEINNNDLPEIKPIDVGDSDKIILIYPLWWGTLPKPVENFLIHSNLQNKTIIPIVTHGGGGIGESVEVIKRSTAAKVVEPLDIYSSNIPSARSIVSDYLNKLQ